jgi:transcriptional regulator with XRE-family HTH domain
MDATTFAARLAAALGRAGQTQTWLARQLDVRNATVSAWVRGDSIPEGQYLLRLPGLLDVDGHWLLTGERHRGAAPPDVEALAFRRVAEVVRQTYAGLSPVRTNADPDEALALLRRIDAAVGSDDPDERARADLKRAGP